MMPGTGVLVVFGGWRIGNVGQDVLLGDTCLLDLDDPWVSDVDQVGLPASSLLPSSGMLLHLLHGTCKFVLGSARGVLGL